MHNAKVSPAIGDGRVQAGLNSRPHFIMRSAIPQYVTPTFWALFRVWHRYHIGLGLPYSGGWAEQPAHLVDVIELYESLYRQFQMERQQVAHANSRRAKGRSKGRSRPRRK